MVKFYPFVKCNYKITEKNNKIVFKIFVLIKFETYKIN